MNSSNIQKSQLPAAIAEIDGALIPPNRQSTRYDLVYEAAGVLRIFEPGLIDDRAHKTAPGSSGAASHSEGAGIKEAICFLPAVSNVKYLQGPEHFALPSRNPTPCP